ncbi:hypothetical protein EHS25_001617 [Saitozyma podzolica]|uniref:Major facilitator superfamily (MFS) profile domain-containing protein n=1 Tax=Saitozyma podzolica TaxID=1890683 RepID=A0A427YGY3_9TREE|nr:hypothetical protein EHS25_001617 [Saitozyma podzolica]
MMLGAIFVGQIHGRIGLRASLVVACVFAIAGIITEQVCKNAAQFLGAKCLAGFGYGIQTALGIMTIPEYAPTRLRGPLGACLNTFILFGGWLADGVLTGTGQVYPDSSRAYQIPFALQYLFVAILVIGLVFVPESASYHLRRDDVLGAKEALTRLHGPQRTARIERELELAIFSYRLDAQNGAQSVGILEPLKKSHWRRSIIPIGLLCFQQLVGGSFVTSYLTYFYEVAGTPDSLSLDLGMMSFSVQVVGNLVSWYAIDKLGRRYTLLVGLGSMTVALLLIGITWAVRTAASLWCMVAFMTIWAFLYQLSIGACGYSVSAEAPAARLRSPTIGLAQALAQVCAWAMGFATPYMINPDEANLGGLVGFVFSGLSALAFVFTFFFVPETSGRTLAEIDELWAEKIPVRRWKGYVKTVRPTEPRA